MIAEVGLVRKDSDRARCIPPGGLDRRGYIAADRTRRSNGAGVRIGERVWRLRSKNDEFVERAAALANEVMASVAASAAAGRRIIEEANWEEREGSCYGEYFRAPGLDRRARLFT